MQNKIYDLKKRTYIYALEVIRFLQELPDDYISKTIGRQLLRSATSVGANVKDSGKAFSDKIDSILNETNELSNILASSILTIKGKRKF